MLKLGHNVLSLVYSWLIKQQVIWVGDLKEKQGFGGKQWVDELWAEEQHRQSHSRGKNSDA